jgi:putative addiction module component (TIGR02574 family)
MVERLMELTPDELTTAVLQLPAPLRAELVERLIESLSDVAEIAPEWFAELERRDKELDRAPSLARPATDVFHRVRARLAQ